jgi:hypothetical protein
MIGPILALVLDSYIIPRFEILFPKIIYFEKCEPVVVNNPSEQFAAITEGWERGCGRAVIRPLTGTPIDGQGRP